MALNTTGLLPVFKNSILYSRFQHPQSVCMSYFDHCMFSLKLARYLAVGSFKAVVHAFFPSLYITSSTDLLVTMKEDMSKIGCHKNKGEVIDKEEEHTDKKEENSWTTRGTSTMEEQHTDKKEENSWTNRGTSIIEENDDDDDLL
jgi:hypothetical protein